MCYATVRCDGFDGERVFYVSFSAAFDFSSLSIVVVLYATSVVVFVVGVL